MIFFRKFLPVILSGLLICAPLTTVCADNQNQSWFSLRYIVPAYVLATVAFTAGLFLLKYHDKIFSRTPKKSFDTLDKSITVGLSECKGDSRTWSKKVVIKQVKVQGQSGATCGYHALKNAILVANELSTPSKTLYDNLLDTQIIQNFINNGFGVWRNLVLERQNNPYSSDKDGEMLRGDALDHLIRYELENRALLHPKTRANFDTVDDINLIGSAYHDHVTARAKANLSKALAIKKPYVHCFLVNCPGHWLSFVLYQKPSGEREYILADSGNVSYLHDTRIEKMITTLEKS